MDHFIIDEVAGRKRTCGAGSGYAAGAHFALFRARLFPLSRSIPQKDVTVRRGQLSASESDATLTYYVGQRGYGVHELFARNLWRAAKQFSSSRKQTHRQTVLFSS